MDFSQALSELKKGSLLHREGWNGKGIHIKLQRPDGKSYMTNPYIYIDTTALETENHKAPKCRVPWIASQTDLMAEDWTVCG